MTRSPPKVPISSYQHIGCVYYNLYILGGHKHLVHCKTQSDKGLSKYGRHTQKKGQIPVTWDKWESKERNVRKTWKRSWHRLQAHSQCPWHTAGIRWDSPEMWVKVGRWTRSANMHGDCHLHFFGRGGSACHQQNHLSNWQMSFVFDEQCPVLSLTMKENSQRREIN